MLDENLIRAEEGVRRAAVTGMEYSRTSNPSPSPQVIENLPCNIERATLLKQQWLPYIMASAISPNTYTKPLFDLHYR